MRKFFYLFLLPLCIGLQACGGDDDASGGSNNGGGESGNEEFELTAENLAKFVSASVNLDEDKKLWTAYINSSLAGQLSDKEIKYGMIVEMTTSRESFWGYTRLEANYGYFGEENPRNGIYAQGSGSSYVVSAENLTYLGMKGYDGDISKTVWIDEVYHDGSMMTTEVLMRDMEKHIQEGTATEKEKQVYEQLLAQYNSWVVQEATFTEGLAYIWSNVAKIFVEIDGTRYVVEETEGDVRIPLNSDFTTHIYISGN